MEERKKYLERILECVSSYYGDRTMHGDRTFYFPANFFFNVCYVFIRPYICPCPGASCKWQGSLEQVMPHLMQSHKSITTLQGKEQLGTCSGYLVTPFLLRCREWLVRCLSLILQCLLDVAKLLNITMQISSYLQELLVNAYYEWIKSH